MPFGDRTGPIGHGPRTGRGAGYCSGNNMPGSANLGGFGRCGGRGRGGFGNRNNFYGTGMFGWQQNIWGAQAPNMAPPTRDEEIGALKNQAEALKNSLDEIERRINEIGEEKSE